ncbi:MAG TPA: hypothetical protein VLU73_14980 [Methylococcaceae bacterium]|jgi:hypothetical protein|nr:hypothetical protein [Methylococcaceae bacterium]
MLKVNRRSIFPPALLGFALYLLLFSAFAEYHAYANDELTDAHGCQIGLWVQHGETGVLSVIVISTALTTLFYSNSLTINAYNRKPFHSTVSLRAPPYSLL